MAGIPCAAQAGRCGRGRCLRAARADRISGLGASAEYAQWHRPMTQPAALPGSKLKAERERRGLSAQKAADEMHLDRWVIDALEADDYQRIGPTVYAKGHLKKYAAHAGSAGIRDPGRIRIASTPARADVAGGRSQHAIAARRDPSPSPGRRSFIQVGGIVAGAVLLSDFLVAALASARQDSRHCADCGIGAPASAGACSCVRRRNRRNPASSRTPLPRRLRRRPRHPRRRARPSRVQRGGGRGAHGARAGCRPRAIAHELFGRFLGGCA